MNDCKDSWDTKLYFQILFSEMVERDRYKMSDNLCVCDICVEFMVANQRLKNCMNINFIALMCTTLENSKMAVFCVVVPCSLVEVYRRVRGL